MSDRRIALTTKPRDGPRRRYTFEPDPRAEGLEYDTWQIEEVYDVESGRWHETGREHVAAPDLVIEADRTIAAPTADTVGCDDV